ADDRPGDGNARHPGHVRAAGPPAGPARRRRPADRGSRRGCRWLPPPGAIPVRALVRAHPVGTNGRRSRLEASARTTASGGRAVARGGRGRRPLGGTVVVVPVVREVPVVAAAARRPPRHLEPDRLPAGGARLADTLIQLINDAERDRVG